MLEKEEEGKTWGWDGCLERCREVVVAEGEEME